MEQSLNEEAVSGNKEQELSFEEQLVLATVLFNAVR